MPAIELRGGVRTFFRDKQDLLYKIGLGVAAGHQALLHIAFFLLAVGVMHRDDWRHIWTWKQIGAETWLDRLQTSDLGHPLIYPLVIQEIGRAVFSSDETFSVAIALLLSFAGFLFVITWLNYRKELPSLHRFVIIAFISSCWLITMGGYPVWSLGSAALMTITGTITMLTFAGKVYGDSPLMTSASSNATQSTPSIMSQVLLFAGCAVVGVTSGGGLVIFPALMILMFLLNVKWRTIILFGLGLVTLLIVLKLGTGAPAASKGALQLESFLVAFTFPAAAPLNALISRLPSSPMWTLAYLLGAIVTIALAYATWHALRLRLFHGEKRPVLAVGLAIAAFGWAMGLLVGIGRIDFGLAQSVFPPRYASLQLLIWIGLFMAYADISAAMTPSNLKGNDRPPVTGPSVFSFGRKTMVAVWTIAAALISALFVWDTWYRLERYDFYHYARAREATLAILSGVHDKTQMKFIYRFPVIIEEVLPFLKKNGLELYSLPQANLVGTRVPKAPPSQLKADGTLRRCRGVTRRESKLAEDKGVRFDGIISRPLALRGTFSDTVAVVDKGGKILGVGGFVGRLPKGLQRRKKVIRRMSIPFRVLFSIHPALPRALGQSVYYAAYVRADIRDKAYAHIYLQNGIPYCRLVLKKRDNK